MNLRHLPRKRYNRRHSTTGFSSCSGGNKLTNVKSFFSLRSGEGFNLSNKDNSASFLVKKSSMKLSELSSFRRCAKKKKIQSRPRSHSRPPITIGSLRCHYGDGKENVTKQLVKISKITTLHVHHAFLYISLTSLHDYDKNCLLSRFIDKVNIRRRISLALFKLGYFS